MSIVGGGRKHINFICISWVLGHVNYIRICRGGGHVNFICIKVGC